MERDQILNYIQGLKKRQKREMDFYDLMLFAGLSLELTNDLRELKGKIQDVSQYLGKSVYIYGPQGSGKTALSGHIFCESMKAGIFSTSLPDDGEYEINNLANSSTYDYEDRYERPSFRWEKFCWYPGLITEVKRTFDKNYEGPSEHEILEQAVEADFLVLDDLGAEYASEWSRNFMYMLIEERKVNLQTTVFTSNYSLEQLAKKYDSHKITSRISGMCRDRIIHLTGEDKRIK